MLSALLRPAAPALLLVLLATACDGGGGGGGGGGTTIVEPPPVQQDTLQRLLSDQELATAADPAAPAENTEWASWVAANHAPLRSLTSTSDYQDLQFLKPLLAGRRVVQLGESGHGVRQFSQAKVRLIRFLHQEMGYDVLAFESSLHDCWQTNRMLGTASSRTAMNECFFRVWHTTDVLPLMDYVRESAGTARPLTLAGFDVQPTSRGVAARARADLLHSVLAVVDPAFAARIQAMDADLTALHSTNVNAFVDLLRLHTDSLAGVYGRAEELIRQNRAAIDAHFAADPQKPVVALSAAYSMRVYIRQSVLPGGDERYATRDRGMADNVDLLLDQLYPGKKVIIWAHNSHIAKGRVIPGRVNMGSLINERRGAEVYTMGLFMYTGSAADNSRTVYDIPLPHPAGSLESILYRARRRWTFVDFSTRANGPGTSWMFQDTPSRSWGVNAERYTPRDFYDGVLFIHTTTPPEYLQ
ncbi:MAG TPA: erythromycin esterase family protein [Longimicrobium sp.]|nr:erythromycin esterase family protein [Longimicrobium sp.]